MYVVVSQWKFGSPHQARQAIQRLQTSFSALIGAQPGLRFWYLVPTGTDELLTIAGWDDQETHLLAQPVLTPWIQEHLAGLEARVQLRRRGVTAGQAGPEAAGYSVAGGGGS